MEYKCKTNEKTRFEGNPMGILCYYCNFTNINSNSKNGGAIYMYIVNAKPANGVPEISHCRFIGCSASNGGAFYHTSKTGKKDMKIQFCYFESNTATQGGGAIYHNGDRGTISECDFINNKAQNGNEIYLCHNDKTNPLVVQNNRFKSDDTSSTSIIYIKSQYNSYLTFKSNNITITSTKLYLINYDKAPSDSAFTTNSNCISSLNLICSKTLSNKIKNGFSDKCLVEEPKTSQPEITQTYSPTNIISPTLTPIISETVAVTCPS